MSKKILIFGAGYAGVEAALELHKKKKKSDDIEITVVDKNSYHTLLTEIHEVAANRLSEEAVSIPLRHIFRYTDVKLVKDEISKIDFEGNKLIAKDTEYAYDYLVLAAGSEPNFFGISGMKEYAYTLWSLKDAVIIRERIKECFILASQEKDEAKKRSLLTFAIGGGGFTGVEFIGELGVWVNVLCRQYDIPRNMVRLVMIEALPTILNILDKGNVAKTKKYMTEKLKIEILENTAIVGLTPDAVNFKDGSSLATKTLIWTAGIKAQCLADDLDADMKNRACRINVDKYATTKHPNVYAIGDMSAFMTGENTLLPALVESAVQTGKGAAHNILADIRGTAKQELKPELHGNMVSVGRYFAVANFNGVITPMWISLIMKHIVNLHYVFTIGGFELIAKYLKLEFFFNGRGDFESRGHLKSKTLSLLLVPLRLFLGYSWLMEGIGKVNEGWLSKALLAGLPDAGAGASVSETGEAIFRIVTENTPSWYAAIANSLVIPNALFFQYLIVLTEIGLGIAFITGTFNFLAGFVSIGLLLNFTFSTGWQDSNWWFLTAAICMIGGSGKSLGIDFYLIPWLMRQWRYWARNHKLKFGLFD